MLTNLDKVFWKEEGYTKGDLINYYDTIAKTILPYLKNRPMVLNRHPNGIADEGFFQKNVTDVPPFVKTHTVQHGKKNVRYVLVQNKETLLYVANLGCIELNPFHSRIADLAKPDYLIFDLDPESTPFRQVIEVAQLIHEILDEMKIPGFCKTSGGRGLHIYVPLGARYDYKQVQMLTKLVALQAQKKLPRLISLEHNPAHRQKRVYIDCPRNAFGQTIAAPYCVRPKPHALVSTPLDWKEVKSNLDPAEFNIQTVPARIRKKGDLFKAILGRGINLEKILAEAESSAI